jgi:uncharacterized SAM-binding protein YcdF (DUF218 family)
MSARTGRRLLLVAAACVAAAALASEAGSTLVTSRHISEPDAVLSLASHDWERLPEAAAVAREVARATVLLTVPRHVTAVNCHRCGERRDWLAQLGIEPSRIAVLPDRVESTLDEARAALEFCRRQGIRRLLVVTSPYHARRTLATFDHVFRGTGIEIGVQPATQFSRAVPEKWWSAPYDRWYVRYEWTAMIFYFTRYGITPWD